MTRRQLRLSPKTSAFLSNMFPLNTVNIGLWGVVPEIAARAHLNHIEFIVENALCQAKVSLEQLDGISVAGGPGIIGGGHCRSYDGKRTCHGKKLSPFSPSII